MGVYDYEQYKQQQQKIEVKALVALLEHGKEFLITKKGYNIYPKLEAEEALYKIAFPDKLAQQINQTKLEDLK